jgi:threonine/homoserine/homoserine lactone efflux protein
MMENFYILSFLWGVGWSFIFSLPPGIINLSVLDATVHKSLKSGIILASAACIVEFVQAFIGTKFSAWFLENPTVSLIIKIAIIPVFLVLSIKYLVKCYKAFKKRKEGFVDDFTHKRAGSFGKGLLVGVLNPIAIPFFLILAAKTSEQGLLKDTWASIFVYVSGTTVGTFCAFLVYGILSKFIAKKLQAIKLWLDLVIGVIFAILAIQQGITMIIKNT